MEAIKLDPKFGPAYDMLAISAEEHGDLDLSREYGRKAHEAWPNDVTLWRHYMGTYTAIGDANLNKAHVRYLEASCGPELASGKFRFNAA